MFRVSHAGDGSGDYVTLQAAAVALFDLGWRPVNHPDFQTHVRGKAVDRAKLLAAVGLVAAVRGTAAGRRYPDGKPRKKRVVGAEKPKIGYETYFWTMVSPAAPDAHGRLYVMCRCTCGVERRVLLKSLRAGGTRSCGCRDRRGKEGKAK